MSLLTESYRETCAKLLRDDPTFGTSGHKWATNVAMLAKQHGTTDILDYGCGRRGLERALGFQIRNYDPCIPGLDATPEPADIVFCGDVLEHIEPDCLDDVLRDLYRVTKQTALLVVATRPALRCLPDGRNAHLIQEKSSWWLPRLWAAGFRLLNFKDAQNQGHSVAFVASFDKGE